MKRNKILWIVIVGLMVLDLLSMMIGQGIGLRAVAELFRDIWIADGLFYFLLAFLPIIMCILIAITKRYKLLWIAIIPSVVAYIAWNILYKLFWYSSEPIIMLFPLLKLLSVCICIVFAYICLLLTKAIKKIKNKKGDNTSC
ncbi:MAG: hypothetical protein FWH04_09570 [Oscillospiraceae bacterium]|nr:hypothetical protein [Oscillospiraceae bacterium]